MASRDTGAERAGPKASGPRFSIPTRIFLGFVVALLSFGAVLGASLWQHGRSTRALRLLDEGYLPLVLTVGEAKVTQVVFSTLLDRLVREDDTRATRSWLRTARRVRPIPVMRALREVEHARTLPRDHEDSIALQLMAGGMMNVQSAYRRNERAYEALDAALSEGDRDHAVRIVADLREQERRVGQRFNAVWNTLQGRLARLSTMAARQERESAFVLGVSTALALVFALLVTWWSQRILRPLPRLHRRVAAVAQGEPSAPLETRRDDELGRLTREFERMLEVLGEQEDQLLRSERLAAIGKMASHVTHEVRNPLSSIGLNLELLEEELGPELLGNARAKEVKPLLEAIHAEIERLRGLTEEYLHLARIPNPRREAEAIDEIVGSVVQLLRPEFEAAGVAFESELGTDGIEVPVDEGQIRQAILNLTRNALEAAAGASPEELKEQRDSGSGAFSERGFAKRGRVRVATALRGESIEISVEDSGPGVPEAQRKQVFDLFYTTKTRGTGLGLPLTQQVAGAHGGSVSCEASELLGGARFLVKLPME